MNIEDADGEATEAVVLVSVSGTVSRERIPAELSAFPVIDLRPSGIVPRLDLLDSPESVASFGEAWRHLLGTVEHDLPRVARLHVLAAAPVPAAVSIGRYRSRSANPNLVVYQRESNEMYTAAVEIDG